MKRTYVVTAVLLALASAVFVWRRQAPAPVEVEQMKPTVDDVESGFVASALTNSASSQRLALMRPSRVAPGSNEGPVVATNLIARLLKAEGEPPRISREQADAFASANGRRAGALLAAWRASGDKSFLDEAKEKFPNNPQVAYMAWSRSRGAEDPEAEKAEREWLDKFKQAAPDNSLADYLSARAHLRAGDLDAALGELTAAGPKPMRDYMLDSIQDTEEAYRSAGFSEAESKAIAYMGALLPQLSQLRALGKSLNELAANRRESGDSASADAAAQWALQVGQRLGREDNLTLLQELVSVAMQRDTLKTLDPNATLGDSGNTVRQRLAALEQQRDAIRGVARDSGEVMPQLSEAELSAYFDRMKLFGEKAAVEWAKTRLGTK